MACEGALPTTHEELTVGAGGRRPTQHTVEDIAPRRPACQGGGAGDEAIRREGTRPAVRHPVPARAPAVELEQRPREDAEHRPAQLVVPTRDGNAADTASSAPTGALAPAAPPQSPGAPPVPSSVGRRNSDRTRAPCTRRAPAARGRTCRSARARSRERGPRTSRTRGTPAPRTPAGSRRGRGGRPPRGTSPGAGG